MKLAFSRPTSNLQEQTLLFNGYRDTGYQGLQLKFGQYDAYVSCPDSFELDWGDDPGLVSGLIFGGALDSAGRDSLTAVGRFAREVGSERVVFCHGVSRRTVTDADIRDFASILSDIGAEFSSLGVNLSLHHHFDQPVMHRHDMDLFFAAVAPGTVKLTVDTAHLVKSGIDDIASIIVDFQHVIDNIHLKDFAASQFRVLGEGNIDFDPVFQALESIGYTGWLCADEESGGPLLAGMVACMTCIESKTRLE